jgi:hypothetical protein
MGETTGITVEVGVARVAGARETTAEVVVVVVVASDIDLYSVLELSPQAMHNANSIEVIDRLYLVYIGVMYVCNKFQGVYSRRTER